MEKNKGPRREYRTFGVWDIETSVEMNRYGRPCDTWLSYGVIGVYLTRDGRPAFRRMFTTWDQFRECLDDIVDLTGGRDFILYAHNFAFESDFLVKHVGGGVKQVVASGPHRPILLRLNAYPSIEFRCSWKLIDESIARIGARVGLPKLDGDYSPLPRGAVPDRKRVEYCTRDCDVAALGVVPFIKEYGNIWRVPYTKTGIVRGMLKDYCRKMDPGREWDLIPPVEYYRIMREAFYGGISISNPAKTGYTVRNVGSFDMSSAYPFVALSEDFPRTMAEGDPKTFDPNGWYIARVRFYGIRSRYEWAWLPSSRMDYGPGVLTFNGKIVEADYVEATLTCVDFHNVELTYTFDRYVVLEYYPLGDVQPLPKPVYSLFEDLAGAKQAAKREYKKDPTPENEIAYGKTKVRFNSCYGMLVQKVTEIDGEEFTIDDFGEWSVTETEHDPDARKHLCRSYLFGVFITAFTRRNLLRFYVTNAGENLVFGDTDSCKMELPPGQVIVNTNAEKMERINREKVGNLGEWERETFAVSVDPADGRKTDTIDEFRTYGAKKYWYRTGDVTHVTVAGLPSKYLDGTPIDTSDAAFHLGHVWKGCKLARAFLSRGKAVSIWENGEQIVVDKAAPDAGGVALYPVDYTLNMTEYDKLYIKLKYERDVL